MLSFLCGVIRLQSYEFPADAANDSWEKIGSCVLSANKLKGLWMDDVRCAMDDERWVGEWAAERINHKENIRNYCCPLKVDVSCARTCKHT